MAPYSPAIGLPLGHESQAPLRPKSHRPKPLTLLTSNHISPSSPLSAPAEVPFALKPRKLIYTPHIPHSTRIRHDDDTSNDYGVLRRSLPGLSTAMFSVLLIMLITLSSSAFSYQQHGREQSVVDMVSQTYFDKPLVERAMVNENENGMSPSGSYKDEMMILDMRKREMPMSNGASASTSASDPVSILASATTTSSAVASSTISSAPHPSKSAFSDPDNVRDPTAVKPDDGQESMAPPDSDSDTQNYGPGMQNKRHWSSRNRPAKVARRSF